MFKLNKIEKLLPEHIAGYLPNGLKCKLSQIGIFNIDAEYSKPKECYDELKIINISISGIMEFELEHKNGWGIGLIGINEFKPLLKPLKSLTPEELSQFSICFRLWYDKDDFDYRQMMYSDIEICHKLHVDYRDLIGNGLAIEK